MRGIGLIVVSFAIAACQSAEKKATPIQQGSGSQRAHNQDGSGGGIPNRPKTEQVTPPLDVKTPPADAVKTASGLIYKKLVSRPEGPTAQRNDTVLINYTGWRQSGETFFSNRSQGKPMPLNLAATAPGFTEAMQLIHKGEKAMLWVPPNIGYKGSPQGNAETLVYEVEVVDISPAPPIPADVAQPPADAKTSPGGIKYISIKPPTGPAGCRNFDTATFHYTGWASDGRMFDTTEMRKKAVSVAPFRQSPAMEEMLTTMSVGERVRFWVEAERMFQNGRKPPNLPQGLVCYELELQAVDKGNAPPPVPSDVAKPPADAQKTAKGVAYKMLKQGKGGPKPKTSDMVTVNYTGWTTDGRMFDSSVIKGDPAEFSLGGVIAGWTDAIPVLSVGDKARFWIPEELAYKGSPGRPQGMLVFDVELLDFKSPMDAAVPVKPSPGDIPAPPDVAKPPPDAKQTAKGVFYKVLAKGKGGPHPNGMSRVKVNYSGWTTNGKMFDSSIKRGAPAEFGLNGVIKGWVDALEQMSVGDKMRFWIPEELAYKGLAGPKGMLVFEIELLEIQ